MSITSGPEGGTKGDCGNNIKSHQRKSDILAQLNKREDGDRFAKEGWEEEEEEKKE